MPATYVAVLLTLTFGIQIAESADSIRFGRSRELKDSGICLNLFSQTIERALPTPKIIGREYPVNLPQKQTSLYRISELWQREQHIGSWADREGRSLTVYSVSLPTPPENNTGISLEKYREWSESAGDADFTPEQLTGWIEAVTGKKAPELEPVKRHHTLKFSEAYTFILKGAPNQLGYLMQIPPPPLSSSRNRRKLWFCAVFSLIPADNIEDAKRYIDTKWMPFFRRIRVSRTPEAKDPSNRFQNKDLIPARNRDNLSASRKQVIESIRNLNEWWYAETSNYILLSDLTSSYASMIKKLQGEMDIMRRGYAEILPFTGRTDAVSVIRIFGNRNEYIEYVGEKYRWSGGLWMPQLKELVISAPQWNNKKAAQDSLRRIVYHEGLHQYLHETVQNHRATSAWFNEGHAMLFTNAEVRNKTLEITEPENEATLLENILDKGTFDLNQLLTVSYPDFYSEHKDIRSKNYASAWALCYYLHKGAVTIRDIRHRDSVKTIIPDYLKYINAGSSPGEATRKAFEEIDKKVFTEDFIAFWKSKSRRSKARRTHIFQ